MTLREQQSLFVKLMVEFIEWVYAQGYELTFGETWRSPQEAEIQAQSGAGIRHTLHTERLAIDLNLFKNGVLLSEKADYQPLGDKWKSMHPLARWGGDFRRVDADHFSLEWQGVE